jgi:hypothetical protein
LIRPADLDLRLVGSAAEAAAVVPRNTPPAHRGGEDTRSDDPRAARARGAGGSGMSDERNRQTPLARSEELAVLVLTHGRSVDRISESTKPSSSPICASPVYAWA